MLDADLKECIRSAKYNLTDPTLPPYYIIEACTLIACALDDWSDEEIWQGRSEHTYWLSFSKATVREDT